jgi:hypothetical protein
VTPTRILLLFVVAIVFIDYKFGNGRLVEAISAQTVQLGRTLSDQAAIIVRRVMP